MTHPTQADVTELARRLADAALIGFGRDGVIATAKVGFTKENPPPDGDVIED